jgi:hypothetical protein
MIKNYQKEVKDAGVAQQCTEDEEHAGKHPEPDVIKLFKSVIYECL